MREGHFVGVVQDGLSWQTSQSSTPAGLSLQTFRSCNLSRHSLSLPLSLSSILQDVLDSGPGESIGACHENDIPLPDALVGGPGQDVRDLEPTAPVLQLYDAPLCYAPVTVMHDL